MAKRAPFFSNSFGLFKQTFSEWLEDKAPQLGAALAYYTVFSLAPLVLVLLAIVGLIFRDGGRHLFSASRFAHIGKRAERLQPLHSGSSAGRNCDRDGGLLDF